MLLRDFYNNKLYGCLTAVPVITILAIVALQTVFSLDSRELWYSDEIRHGNAFQNLIYENKWIVLYLNGEVYPDKPPVYFWFISLIYFFMDEISPRLFFIGAAVSGALFAVSTYALSRSLHQDKNVSLLSCLIILTVFYFITLLHYARMDLLFAAFITLSHLCLYKGQQKDESLGWMTAGFVFAGLATLTKGPLGFAFPIITLVAFLLCQGRIRRLIRRDIALGLGLMTGMCLAWFLGAYLVEGPEFIKNIFEKQIFGRTVDSWHHKHPWWHYLAVLPAIMLPWSLILLILPWKKKIFTSNIAGNISSFFKSKDETSTYLWVSFVSGFILLSLISTKVAIYLLPLFPPLVIIIARYLVALGEDKFATLYKSFAAVIFMLGIVFIFFKFLNPWQIEIKGSVIAGLLGLVLGLLLWMFPPKKALSGALILAFMMIIWIQPVAMMVAPSLDEVMSPVQRAQLMQEYILDGYHPVSYRIYSGTYTYYTGHKITETRDGDYLNDLFKEHENIVLAIRQKHWDSWKDRPENLRIVHSQFLVEHRLSNKYLLAVTEDLGFLPSAKIY